MGSSRDASPGAKAREGLLPLLMGKRTQGETEGFLQVLSMNSEGGLESHFRWGAWGEPGFSSLRSGPTGPAPSSSGWL